MLTYFVHVGGNAYLHWKLAKFFAAEKDSERVEDHRVKAVQAISVAVSLLPQPSSRGIAFYIGNAGIPKHGCVHGMNVLYKPRTLLMESNT